MSVEWGFCGYFLNAGSFLYLKHHLWSDCVCTPESTCCPLMFTLGLYTKLWNLWLKHCCFLDVTFLCPFQVGKRSFCFFYHVLVLSFSSAYDDTLPKIRWYLSSKPFPSVLVRGNVDRIKSQDYFWRWIVVLLQPGLWCAFFLSFLQFHDFISSSVRQGAAENVQKNWIPLCIEYQQKVVKREFHFCSVEKIKN